MENKVIKEDSKEEIKVNNQEENSSNKATPANKPKISPLEMFFALGDKATGGDPEKKADFDYYMLWVIFMAFFGVFFGNIKNFIATMEFQFLGWALFGLAIMWFQYFNLKMSWQMRKIRKEAKNSQKPKEEESKIESIDEMLADFNKEDLTKEENASEKEEEEVKDAGVEKA